MQKRWNHPEYRLDRTRQVVIRLEHCLDDNDGEFVRMGAANSKSSGKNPALALLRSKADIQSFFCLTCILSLLLVGIIVFCNSKAALVTELLQKEGTLSLRSIEAALDKPSFLAKLSQQQQRQLGGQIHYISELIKRDGSAEDAWHRRLAATIVVESLRANYDPLLVAAVINAESRFNRHAISNQGAQGLMQILPTTGKYISNRKGFTWRGSSMLKDPEYNIKLGIAYLKYLEGYFGGNREKILIAYNWGPANLMNALKSNSRVPYSPVKYARGILSTHQKWRRDLDSRVAQYRFLKMDSLPS